jgi:DNA mismatch repair protein MutS
MMRQYQELKSRYPGALLMFRLGDFYELFFDDAVLASRELDIVLTSRPTAKDQRIPMCGVPHHALNGYLARLVERGFRVAICEQVEDPRKAKGLVRRDVARVVSAGTVMDATVLPAREHRFVAAVAGDERARGLAAVDLSTGDFLVTEIDGEGVDRRLADELGRLAPREIVVADETVRVPGADRIDAVRTPFEPWRFDSGVARRALLEHFRVVSLEGFGCEHLPHATAAAGALLQYLRATQFSALHHIRSLRVYSTDAVLGVDAISQRNLDILRNRRDGTSSNTLLGVLDETVTAMGGRLLREWLIRPLIDADAIRSRHLAVAVALESRDRRRTLRDGMRDLPDLARLVGRIGHGSATARDLVSLRLGLDRLVAIRAEAPKLGDHQYAALASRIDLHPEIAAHIERAIVDHPPVSVKEGGMIRPGYHPSLDTLRDAASGGKAWIATLEAAERERTGIRSLRVGFNKVFGYYIEISHANRSLVPAEYIRKQTLTGAERYITPEMKEREAVILGAEERMAEMEHELFAAVRDEVAAASASLIETARAVGELDALLALAEVAERRAYVRPEIVDEPVLEIIGGRHPVVEALLDGERFVPNDLRLDVDDRAILIVTGPNMAGKSTLLRQAALIAIMAQMGSFVPAARARIGIADRIFTRVGASDDLASGRSTFLVEMQEMARILLGATRRSLIVLDEVGRGTSTYDGMSLAWAVVDYLHREIGARTLFATHFHELTELADTLPRVHNISMRVHEQGDEIVFLHAVADGRADRSYGIHVAQIAGVPSPVIEEARKVLQQLEAAAARPRDAGSEAGSESVPMPARARRARQMVLALDVSSPIEAALLELAIDSMTPLDAMRTLAELRDRVRSQRAGRDKTEVDRRRVQ